MSAGRAGPAVLLRSRAYVVSPGSPCPGTLEVTTSGVAFRADSAVWLFGGFGCRRDLDFPVECLKSVSSSSWWESARRLWPGRLLVLEVLSGRRILFGVPGLDDWEQRLRKFPPGTRECDDLDNTLSHATRTMLLDFALLGLGGAVCVGLGTAFGQPALFGAMTALLAGRYALRARSCQSAS